MKQLSDVGRRAIGTAFRRSTFGLLLATTGSQILQAIFTPVLSRLYGPDVYGSANIVLSFAGLALILGGFRYELAIVPAEDDYDAVHVFALQMICSALSAAIVLIGVLLLRDRLATALGGFDIRAIMYWCPIIVFFTSSGLGLTNWFIRAGDYRAVGALILTQAGVLCVSQLALAPITHASPTGLVVGSAFGQMAMVVFLSRCHLGRVQPRSSRHELWSAARKYARFPRYMIPYSAVAVIRERGTVILLGVLAGSSSAGFFVLAQRALYTTAGGFARGISSTVYGRASTSQDISLSGSVVTRLFVLLAAVVTPGCVFVLWGATSSNLAGLLGPAWADLSIYIVAFVVPSYLYLFAACTDRLLDLVGRQRFVFWLEAAYSAVCGGGVAWVLIASRNPKAAVLVYAVCTSLYHAAWVVAVYSVCGFGIARLARVTRTAGVTALSIGIPLYTVSRIGSGTSALLGGVAILLMAYCGVAVFVRRLL